MIFLKFFQEFPIRQVSFNTEHVVVAKYKILMLVVVCALCACEDENKLRGAGPAEKPSPTPTPQTQQGSIAEQGAVETFTGADGVGFQSDIIFFLDTSPSMDSHIRETMQNLNGLINDYLNKVQGLDYQLIFVGNNSVEGNGFNVSGPNIGRVNHYVGSHSALAVGQSLLNGKHTISNNLKIRETAIKEFVIVSDDDSDVTADAFISWMDANPTVANEIRVNGIIGKNGGCGLFSGGKGHVYLDLAARQRTQGVIGNICSNSSGWQAIFDQLGASLSQFKSPPAVIITLKNKPASLSQVQVSINGQPVDPSKLEYDEPTNRLLIKVPTSRNDTITVAFK